MSKVLILSLIILFARLAGGEVLLYEGFDYPSDGWNPEDGLIGKDGGVGFRGPWLPSYPNPDGSAMLPFGVHEQGLTYSKNGIDLEVSGRSMYSQISVPRACDQQVRNTVDLGIGIEGNTRWFSMLIHFTDHPEQLGPPPPGVAWFFVIRFSGIDNGFGRQSGASQWGMHYRTRPYGVISGGGNVRFGQTTLLVMKVDYGRTRQTNTLWVNPTPAVNRSVLEPEEFPTLKAVPMALSGNTNQINLTSGCQAYADEIRVGTTYYDVAPAMAENAPWRPVPWSPANDPLSEWAAKLSDSGLTVRPRPPEATNAGTVQFRPANYTVDESAGWAALTVTREGGKDGSASVNYATEGGTAASGADFTPAGGTLFWADGDSAPKTVDVQILRDASTEGDETFRVRLNTPGSAALGRAASATVLLPAH
jgi:hypothetical protein